MSANIRSYHILKAVAEFDNSLVAGANTFRIGNFIKDTKKIYNTEIRLKCWIFSQKINMNKIQKYRIYQLLSMLELRDQ